jgi:hypothetical protein
MRCCGRPGCGGTAVATFTFDSAQGAVWIEDAADDRHVGWGGRLCNRHADALAPPRGWRIYDLRGLPDKVEVPSGNTAVPVVAEPLVSPPAANVEAGVLDARTPLLARAFRAAGAS